MTEEQNAAYVFSQTTCALIEAMGMIAENASQGQNGKPIVFHKIDFDELIEKYGIHHNAVVTTFRE